MRGLQGKTVLIAGGTGGVGTAIEGAVSGGFTQMSA